MRSRVLLVLWLVGALLALILVGFPPQEIAIAEQPGDVSGGGDFELKDAYWSDWRGRGLNNTFCVVLRYLASEAASSLNATLDVSAVSPDEPLANASYPWSVSEGQSVSFYFTFPVSGNATASHYNFTLTIVYLKGSQLCAHEEIIVATVEGSPHMSVRMEPLQLEKLEVNEVELVVENEGDGVARGLRLEVNSQSPYVTVLGPNVFERDLLWPGQAWRVRLRLFVEAGEGRSTSLRVTVSYSDQRGRGFTQNLAFGLQVEEPPGPDLEIRALNESLTPNRVNELFFQVENVGREVAKDITISFYSQVEFMCVLGAGSFKRGELRPGEIWNITVSIFVQPRVYGAASLYVLATYSDPRGAESREAIQVGFRVEGRAELAISKVIYTPPAVMPGDRYVFLMVIFTNIGDYVAKEVELELLGIPGVVEPSYAGAGEAMIPYMPVGYVANATFLVDVSEDAKPGFYEIPLLVQHDGLNYTLKVPFTIREKAVFRLVRLEFSPKPYPGAKGVRAVIEIRNVSNVTAQEVRISLVSAYVRGVTAILLGDMAGGESRVAVLEIDFDEATPLDLSFDLQISWRQGERALTETLRCSAELYMPSKWPEAREIAIWVGLVALGAALAFAIMKVRRGFF